MNLFENDSNPQGSLLSSIHGYIRAYGYGAVLNEWTTLFNNSSLSLALFDNDLKLIHSSKAFKHLVEHDNGCAPLHWEGKTFEELFITCPIRLKDCLKKSFEGHFIRRDFMGYYAQDGHETWLRWESFPWMYEGNKKGGVIVFTENITPLKRLRDQTKALSKCNQALENFAQVCCHDLVEPLRRLVNLTQLMEREPLGSSQRQLYMNNIHQSADHMHFLIRGILSYSTAGKMDVDEKWVSLSKMLQNIYTSVVAPLSGDTVSFIRPKKSLPFLFINEVALNQLFQNLITNAIKYAHAEVPRVEIKLTQNQEGFSVFHIMDNGPGIPSHLHDAIFKPLTRGHHPKEKEGVGIGLAICQRIVKAYGGDIWIDKTYINGTCFSFTLPYVKMSHPSSFKRQAG
jgi:signal transduction histidine kinase